jgi:2-polyprenyl-3-methyl-5-hydroxy-6-metoxy-1,4-benzoquinol methylase
MNKDKISIKVNKIIDEILHEYQVEPVAFYGNGEGEYKWLKQRKSFYQKTVTDIIKYFGKTDINETKILEIGSYLGLTSIALSKLGFKVTALDIEEFIACERLQRKFSKYSINYLSCNLRNYKLPFKDDEFHAVIMGEVLEHLNFNPLPVIKEINRVINKNGILYIIVPNIASGSRRLRLLEGKPVQLPIKHFFSQLQENTPDIVGLHWKEYTADELRELLEMMDFKVVNQMYISDRPTSSPRRSPKYYAKKGFGYFLNLPSIKRRVLRCMLDWDNDPSLQPMHAAVACKKDICVREFFFTDATGPM